MDIGCGKNAYLVRYLRSKGIEAEGIDPTIIDYEKFLISRVVGLPSSIPRENHSYDLVVTNSNPIFYLGLSSYRDLERKIAEENHEDPSEVNGRINRALVDSHLVILEAMRVLKRNGKFIIWPDADMIGDLGNLLEREGYKSEREKLPFNLAEIPRQREEQIKDKMRSLGMRTDFPAEILNYRTILSYK